jgi:SagB-type dehydrogenase family enzyme
VACWWEADGFVLEEFVVKRRIRASPLTAQLLGAFGRPRTLEAAARLFPQYERSSVASGMRSLVRLGFLVPVSKVPPSRSASWNDAFAAAFLHFSTKSDRYVSELGEERAWYEARLKEERQPPLFKEYRGVRRIPLPAARSSALGGALAARRTSRRFGSRPVPIEALAAVLSGAFARTGWIDAGMLGKKLATSSPSAGARHPLECYVLAWNVEGLAKGVYHFSVKRRALERLASRDPRREVVRFASGQRWISRAGFACVLTAVVKRTLWKYPASGAYRLLLLEAGHVAQTFLLLAAEEGLGGFVTAALQHDAAERSLALDGVSEIVLYLCGAGTLTKETSAPRGASARARGTSRASPPRSRSRRGSAGS